MQDHTPFIEPHLRVIHNNSSKQGGKEKIFMQKALA
jgi:hypothetical protein